jgi:MOSC domain-containing protein YiiM
VARREPACQFSPTARCGVGLSSALRHRLPSPPVTPARLWDTTRETRGIRSASQSTWAQCLSGAGTPGSEADPTESVLAYLFRHICRPKQHMTGRLVSINVGFPRDVAWRGETVHTAIWKLPVQGRVAVRRLNVEGDGQGDLAGHGGEHRAVMVYQMDAYRYWEAYLGRNDFSAGQFGENFTVLGLPDNEVCIGDRYRIGSALLEVTQPRVTCYRVGIRMAEQAMPALLVSHHRPGFYCRVLEEGEVGAGDEITKMAAGPEHITVADIDALLYLPDPSREQLERSLRVPALSQGWRTSLKAIAGRKTSDGGNPGLKASGGPPPAWPGFRRVTRRQCRSGNCRCGLVVHRTNGRDGSARTVSRSAVAHRTRRPSAAPELLDVRHARRQDLSRKHQTRDERGCQLVSLRSRTRG